MYKITATLVLQILPCAQRVLSTDLSLWDRASWYISIVKPTRCTIFFFKFIEYHSTCLGQSFRPSSGVKLPHRTSMRKFLQQRHTNTTKEHSAFTNPNSKHVPEIHLGAVKVVKSFINNIEKIGEENCTFCNCIFFSLMIVTRLSETCSVK